MPELIDKNALIRKFCAECQHCYRVDKAGGEPTMCKTVMMIAEMPTIEPEVLHGRWIELPKSCQADYECSECGAGIGEVKPPYCTYCGARMDGGING